MWKMYERKLARRIIKITGSPDAVEDLLQNLFLKVYSKAEKLDGDGAKYLMRAASNVAWDYVRKQRRLGLQCEVPEAVCGETPYELYLAKERVALYVHHVLPALELLPEKEREAVEMFMNYERRAEAARELGIPYSTLKSRERAGLRKLRKVLEAYEQRDLEE